MRSLGFGALATISAFFGCFGFCGCVGTSLGTVVARQHVVTAAASDHACDKDRISVTREDSDTWSYDLLVCGQARTYHDIGGKSGWHFVEVAEDAPSTPAPASPPPPSPPAPSP
jgi:hypothetical protein